MSLRAESGVSSADCGVDSIRVLVRVRPLLPSEFNDADERPTEAVTVVPDRKEVIVKSALKHICCAYDHVFGPVSTQSEVYAQVKGCTDAAINGFNATILAYGQTGTGKTYTMFGQDGRTRDGHLPVMAGLVPRCIHDIFQLKHWGKVTSFKVHISFSQIYNEQVFDMFRDSQRRHPLNVLDEKGKAIKGHRQGVYVSGLSEFSVTSAEQCMALLEIGLDNRAIRETSMNNASSRSHSIFQITIEQTRIEIEGGTEGERILRSKLSLVDLAGSERWNTQRDEKMAVEQISEMTNINFSLHTLARCIAALAEISRESHNGRSRVANTRVAHVPFRDSKLTRLLQDSLTSKTALIATISPSSECEEESVSTLRFADRAHQVMTFSKRNEECPIDSAVVKQLQLEIARLKNLLNEHGVNCENARADIFNTQKQCDASKLYGDMSTSERVQSSSHRKAYNDRLEDVGSMESRHEIEAINLIDSFCSNSDVETRTNDGDISVYSKDDTDITLRPTSSPAAAYYKIVQIAKDMQQLVKDFLSLKIEEDTLQDGMNKLDLLFFEEILANRKHLQLESVTHKDSINNLQYQKKLVPSNECAVKAVLHCKEESHKKTALTTLLHQRKNLKGTSTSAPSAWSADHMSKTIRNEIVRSQLDSVADMDQDRET